MSSECDKDTTTTTTCRICSELLLDPRLLPCLHSFCLKCLQKQFTEAQDNLQQQQGVVCIVCGAPATIPSEGVGGFPQNLHLAFEVEASRIVSQLGTQECGGCGNTCGSELRAFCVGCLEFLCPSCQDYHKRQRIFKQHEVLELGEDATSRLLATLKPRQAPCTEAGHGDTFKFYCKTCSRLVCRECTILTHRDHVHVEIAPAAEEQRGELRSLLESCLELDGKLTQAIGKGEAVLEYVDTSRKEAITVIEEAFDKLHQALEEKRLSLIAATNDIALYRTTALNTQKQEWEESYNQLSRYVDKSNDVLSTHSDEQLLALRGCMHKTLCTLVEKGSAICFEPNQHSDIPVSVSTATLLREIPLCGFVVDYSPSKSIWVQRTLPVTNSKYELFLESRSPSDEKLTNGDLFIEAVLKTYSKVEVDVRGEVEDHGNGTYTITFTPHTNGLYQLRVLMNGQHVCNSPCDVEVRGIQTKRGKKMARNYNAARNVQLTIPIVFPWQVSVHDNGTIYVSDIGNLCIHALDLLGNKKAVIGSPGTSKVQFSSPRGMALKGEVMFVTDSCDHCVHKITLKGDLLLTFGKHGRAEGMLNVPMGICLDPEDRIVVANSHNHRIEVFTAEGKFSHSIAGNSAGSKGFVMPWDVAMDPWGNLHIAAWGTGAIKVFTVEGMFVRSYGEKVLVNPRGVAIDGGGYVFVSDGGTNSVVVLDPTGKCVHTIHNLDSPTGVALDQDSGIYVANYGSGNVLRY